MAFSGVTPVKIDQITLITNNISDRYSTYPAKQSIAYLHGQTHYSLWKRS